MRPLPFQAVTGRSRSASWRRGIARRVLAAACLCTATLLVLTELRPAPERVVPVVVAQHDVPAGSVLRAEDLRAVRAAAAGVQPGSISDLTDPVGRRIGSALAAGEALTRTRLVPRSATDGLPASRTVLHVVVADPASVSLLRVGQRVRVYALGDGQVLSRDAEVLSTDPETPVQQFEGPTASSRGVVLSVDSDDVEGLLTASEALAGAPVVHVIGAG